MNIGLLGGSFNPAHEGHKYISETALDQLSLDQVWWVITPHNPQKDSNNLYPLKNRLKIANQIKNNSQIKIKSQEKEGVLNYSHILITEILEQNPSHHFCWLMGSDNLINFHSWKNWVKIANQINIAIFPRNNLSSKINTCPFALKFANFFITQKQAKTILSYPPPKWTILTMPEIDISSTQIRNI